MGNRSQLASHIEGFKRRFNGGEMYNILPNLSVEIQELRRVNASIDLGTRLVQHTALPSTFCAGELQLLPVVQMNRQERALTRYSDQSIPLDCSV